MSRKQQMEAVRAGVMSRLVALGLALGLVLPAPLLAQQAPGQVVQPPQAVKAQVPVKAEGEAQGGRAPAPGRLKLVVLEGQDAVNSISSGMALSPVVQVLDAVDQPVAGAMVTFEVPATGAGGVFGAGPVAKVKTDSVGQATSKLTPNKVAGAFTIKVTAEYGGQAGEARIRQANDSKALMAMVPEPEKRWYQKKKWLLIMGAAAGAGVAAAIILPGRNDTTGITITPGSIGIGGPK